jgi:hypothetical protein
MTRGVWPGLVLLLLVACGGSQSSPTILIQPAGGPSRQVLGVGVGYTHDQAGALAAAVTYAEAAATPIFPVDAATETQRVAAYAAGAEQSSLLQQRLQSIRGYDSSYGVVQAHDRGLKAGAHLYPLTVTLLAYSDSSASVSVWANLVEYGPSVFRALYVTETVALRWESNDWKFVPSQTSATLGPVPEITQAQTTSQPPNQVDWPAWGR